MSDNAAAEASYDRAPSSAVWFLFLLGLFVQFLGQFFCRRRKLFTKI